MHRGGLLHGCYFLSKFFIAQASAIKKFMLSAAIIITIITIKRRKRNNLEVK